LTGAQEESDATIEFLKAIDHPISKTAQVLVDACAYAGTGNVLKIQTMLHHCDHISVSTDGDKDEKDEKIDDTFQAFAVLAISLIAMGEEIGAEMSLRQFNHLVSLLFWVIQERVKLTSNELDALWRTCDPKSRSSSYRSRQRFKSPTPTP
jgi:26S proteasome regulatory subunit N1